MTEKLINRHTFIFNKGDNGGEQLILTTTFFADVDDNGNYVEPGNVYRNDELSLQSYCNSASFNLYCSSLTPAILRELADSLEQATNDAKQMTLGR